jgi:flagellar biosynthetic protein FliQ
MAAFEAALREAARLLGALALPILLAVLAVGILVAVLQAVTKVRDRSISVVPRLLAVGLALSLLGGWFAGRLGSFAAEMFRAVETVGRAQGAGSGAGGGNGR